MSASEEKDGAGGTENPISNVERSDVFEVEPVDPESPKPATMTEDMYTAIQQAAFGKVALGKHDDDCDADYRKKWFGILHPDTRPRAIYDFFQLCIMVYLAYLLPIRLAFNKGPSGPLEVIIDLFIDASVWIDMIAQMKMYQWNPKTNRLITDGVQLKKAYLRHWFVIDFCSVVPIDQVLFTVGTFMVDGASSATRLEWGLMLLEWSVTARMLRLLRLVRLVKIKALLNISQLIHSIYTALSPFMDINKLQISFCFRLAALVLLILATGHFVGCGWLSLGRYNVLMVQNPSGWMVSACAFQLQWPLQKIACNALESYLRCVCAGADDQGSVNRTKDYVSCIGGYFDASQWNAKHGSSCIPADEVCNPIPKETPYDVDCSWIKDRDKVLGGTGYGNGVGASEGEQYLSAFYFSM
eukprot:SAG11_NODE_910_length_6585_cov_7.205520_7_plen_413_part_00